MTSPAELAAQITQTRAFIAADATVVVLIPRVETPTASGGSSYADGTPRPSQTVKMSLLNYDQRPSVTLAGGVVRLVDYHMIMLPDAEVAVNDYWMIGAQRYEVVGVSDGRAYEKKVFVSLRLPKTEIPANG